VVETEFFFQLLMSLLAWPLGRVRRSVVAGRLARYLFPRDLRCSRMSQNLPAGHILLTLVPDPLRLSVRAPLANRAKRLRMCPWHRPAVFGRALSSEFGTLAEWKCSKQPFKLWRLT
jgi:hypothetical protein